jgi:hypothetical protein
MVSQLRGQLQHLHAVPPISGANQQTLRSSVLVSPGSRPFLQVRKTLAREVELVVQALIEAAAVLLNLQLNAETNHHCFSSHNFLPIRPNRTLLHRLLMAAVGLKAESRRRDWALQGLTDLKTLRVLTS